jgi:hypothetical protein
MRPRSWREQADRPALSDLLPTAPASPLFAQAVVAGGFLYVSGTVGIDRLVVLAS